MGGNRTSPHDTRGNKRKRRSQSSTSSKASKASTKRKKRGKKGKPLFVDLKHYILSLTVSKKTPKTLIQDITLVMREAEDKQEEDGNLKWFHKLRSKKTVRIMIAVLGLNKKESLEHHAEAREKAAKLAHRQLGWRKAIRMMIAGQS